ncbi:hypothetical protein [Oleiphilus messinensis]|uniref:hypothetical protein n=1 Tax=Oleiphilus messinensis TaxID=141451 RepID=UPI0012F81D5C|nr:hypothetical protein [Oleiphilus messinensis]
MTADQKNSPLNLADTQNGVDAVKSIEERRSALEEIARLILNFQRLAASLNNIIAISSNDSLSEKAFELLDSLDEKQRALSSDDVEFRLETLENKIRDDVYYFINLKHDAEPYIAKDIPPDDVLSHQRVEEFKRRVKLVLAYRVLLCERGEQVQGFEIDIPVNTLKNYISKLRIQERIYKAKLLKDMKELQIELKGLIKSYSRIPDLKDRLSSMLTGVECNINHIESGKSVASLPMAFDRIDLNQTAEEPEEVPLPVPEVTEDETSESNRKHGLLDSVNEWLNSPMDVKWKDVRKQQKGQ